MPTANQNLGKLGEHAVCRYVACPRCNRERQLRPLTQNFECVDVICKFCGFLAQVKATRDGSADHRPDRIRGAGWGPQHERIINGIFHALFVVSFDGAKLQRIDYVPAHMLAAFPGVYKPSAKLSERAQRSGWQGFTYDLRELPPVASVKVFPRASAAES